MAWKLKIAQLMDEAESGSPAGGAVVETNPVVDEPLDADAELFESLADEFEEEDGNGDGETAPVVETPPVAEVTPPPVEVPAVVAPVAVIPEPAKPDASAPTTVESPAPVAQTYVQPNRDEVVAELSTHMAITNEDDIELLRTEPEKAIPKIMAGMFFDIHATVMRQVSDSLPNMLQSIQSRVVETREAEDAFFSSWPLLKDHQAAVLSIGRVYRQANPNADKETAIREIGAMAMVQAKIPFDFATGKAIAPAATPPTPAFRPVVTSGVTSSPSSAPADTWSQLVEEFSREDLE